MKNLLLFLILYGGFTYTSNAQQTDFKHINFKYADSIAQLYKNENLHNLPLLSYKLTYRLKTDVEKFRAIYVWVCSNIKSDYKKANTILKKGKKHRDNRAVFLNWNNTYKATFLKRLIEDKKTVCTGYAFLVKELAALANIECEIINGYHKNTKFNPEKLFPNHSWNSVKLNNKWYLCDPILASGYYFVDINRFIFDYNDGFFLTDPHLFIKDHYPEDTKWTLLDNNTYNFQNFIAAPFVYTATYKHKITPLVPYTTLTEATINQRLPFEFAIDNSAVLTSVTLEHNNGWKNVAIPITNYTYTQGVLKFQHQFTKKGIYDLHIKIANDVVASYTVNISS